MVVTKDKIKIYKKYSGDIDGWARVGKKSELELMSDEDWAVIDELIQNLELVEKGVVSDSFMSQTFDKLKKVCDSERTQNELKSLIGKY